MRKRNLGNSGLEVSLLGFGGNVFGWTVDERKSFRLLDAFVAAGLNLIDTADVYSSWAPGNVGGESETIIGKWLKRSGNRDAVILITKVGMEIGSGNKGLSKAHIRRAVEGSLRRLETDYIDLYQAHIDDAATPLHETLEAFAQLIKEGKVRTIGASNYSADRLRQSLNLSQQLGLPRYQSLEPRYNLCDRAGYESALEAVCLEHGLGVISYSSLASGFLTGKYRSERHLEKNVRSPSVTGYLNERGMRIINLLDEVAQKYGATSATVALAWLIARPSITAPIASATSLEQLNDLIRATTLSLDHMDIERLNQASA